MSTGKSTTASAAPVAKPLTKLLIRSWPKMLFFYPTAVVSFVLAVTQYFLQENQPSADTWGLIFLVVMTFNLFVLTFEFPRATVLTIIAAVIAFVVSLILLNTWFSIFPVIGQFISHLQIRASTEFYLAFAVFYLLLVIGMYVVTRFDYWELSANELVHHHGVLGDVERFSTAGLKLNKEITDIFEYFIGGAGRLVMTIPGSPRPVVLENVPRVNLITKLADRLLEARMVRVEPMVAASPGDQVVRPEDDDVG